MCYFVFVALPKGEALVVSEDQARDLRARQLECRTVQEYFGPTRDVWSLTNGANCSCTIYEAPVSDEEFQAAELEREDRLRRRFQSKRWSSAKVERAIRDSRRSTTDREPRHLWGASGMRKNARQQIADAAATSGTIGLVVHEFTGYVADERFKIVQGRKLRASTFLAGDTPIDVDTCYTIIQG